MQQREGPTTSNILLQDTDVPLARVHKKKPKLLDCVLYGEHKGSTAGCTNPFTNLATGLEPSLLSLSAAQLCSRSHYFALDRTTLLSAALLRSRALNFFTITIQFRTRPHYLAVALLNSY